ncbi:MAG: phosphoribosylamine--glycine ligase [Bryobacterales bacterium]|nr:phosphoribosylamine--glycine ligase [Bryobacterales bacterium]
MKVLIVGNGGREHAIAWKLAQSANPAQLLMLPGNAGTTALATNVNSLNSQPESIADFAAEQDVQLVVVGPEAPLVAGLADCLRGKGIPVIGPSALAAELEGSKIYAKGFFKRYGIPTAAFFTAESVEQAEEALSHFDGPVVIKADGLAAGKGVIIAQTKAEAHAAIASLMKQEVLGAAGRKLVLEEFLIGEEVSFIALTDGERICAFPPCQDHKAIYDGDQGPNTGGMGAYCDQRILTKQQQDVILNEIILPTLQGLRDEGRPFQGFLFAGLMMTSTGPKALEFNVRLGDPETQAILHGMRGDFLDLLQSCAAGYLDPRIVSWGPDPSVCVVLAAANYPGAPRTGDAIVGLDEATATGATVFHAGTRLDAGTVRTAGGRVLGVTAGGSTLEAAIANAYHAADLIQFDGKQQRRDIGAKGLKRW